MHLISVSLHDVIKLTKNSQYMTDCTNVLVKILQYGRDGIIKMEYFDTSTVRNIILGICYASTKHFSGAFIQMVYTICELTNPCSADKLYGSWKNILNMVREILGTGVYSPGVDNHVQLNDKK